MRLSFLLSLLFVASACGGKIADDGDGGPDASGSDSTTKPDVPTPDATPIVDVIVPPGPDAKPPPPISCSNKDGQGYAGPNGECGENDTWKCTDGNAYELACKCPPDPNGQTCACRKNGLTTKVFFGNVCPGCGGVVKFAKDCGFPE
jgi:hypothetical protein